MIHGMYLFTGFWSRVHRSSITDYLERRNPLGLPRTPGHENQYSESF